jgi:hypothetical protein
MWAPLLWFLVNPAATGMDVADPVALTFTVSAELPVSTSSIIPLVNEAPPDATGIAVVLRKPGHHRLPAAYLGREPATSSRSSWAWPVAP